MLGAIITAANTLAVKLPAKSATDRSSPLGIRSPLFARGASIVDQNGGPVMLHGIGWFEGYASPGWLAGLDQVNWQRTLHDMVRLGFNCVRLHTFQRGVLNVMAHGDKAWPMWRGLNKTLNADLGGLGYLQVIDKILDFAATIGLGVLIDSHSSDGDVPNNGGRWAIGSVSDAEFLKQWQYMADRWKGKEALIGYELINEPQHCTWGDGKPNDIRKMFSDVGSAIISIDPRPLIVCQGPGIWGPHTNFAGTYSGNFCQQDLSLVHKMPVSCPVPVGAPMGTTKIVYSVHEYPVPWSIAPTSGSEYIEKLERNWGYVVTNDIAPVWLTEFGCAPRDQSQIDHLNSLIPYMAGTLPGHERKLCHSSWWCWMPFGYFPRAEVDCGTITGWANPSLLPRNADWEQQIFTSKAK
jgi:aryl-phospho-beta-D-glucosidase BglC (GH1 family)